MNMPKNRQLEALNKTPSVMNNGEELSFSQYGGIIPVFYDTWSKTATSTKVNKVKEQSCHLYLSVKYRFHVKKQNRQDMRKKL